MFPLPLSGCCKTRRAVAALENSALLNFVLWIFENVRVSFARFMSRPIKIVLYVVFITMALLFGLLARENFRRASAAEKTRERNFDDASATENTNVTVVEGTNVTAITNATAAS